METNFTLMDKINNLQKEALAIVKFNFESKDYLIYSVKESDENCQILASRLISNSEGMHFLDNITAEEKGKLNTLIYNLVILIPTESKKGTDPTSLLNDITNKYFAKVSLDIPEFSTQEYYSNCSFAITNKALVAEAINFYKNNLHEEKKEEVTNAVPAWDIPSADAVVSPIETTDVPPIEIPVENTVPVDTAAPVENSPMPSEVTIPEPVSAPTVPVEPVQPEPVATGNMPNITLNISDMEQAPKEPTSFVAMPTEIKTPQASEAPVVETPVAPQNVAVVADPTLLNAVNNAAPAVPENSAPADNKKAGFAVNKFIVIGSVCLVLAIAVVVVAYILIKQKTTGV